MPGKPSKEGIQPHVSKGTQVRHVDVGQGKGKIHHIVKNDLGATAVYGARKGVKKK